MYKVDLYRADQGLQDEIEIGVLSLQDEKYLKSKGIQIDMIDMTFDIRLNAKLADGRVIEYSKNKKTMKQAFAELVKICKHTIENVPLVVH